MHGNQDSSQTIDVLVVDDSPDITTMISRLLSAEPDMRVVGTLHEAGPLAETISRLRPRVVLLDLTMPGTPVLSALKAAQPVCSATGTRVLAFSGHDDDDTEAEAKAAGACRLVSKVEDPESIVRAVRQAGRGN